MGDMDKVSAWIDTLDGIIDSPAFIMWKHRDGIKYGVCDYANARQMNIPSKYYANDEWFEITGTKGIIQVHRCTGNILRGPAVSLFNGKSWRHFNAPSDWGAGFIGSTKNFIASIMGKEQPLLSGGEAREILKFNFAIQKSSHLLREVYLDEMDRSLPSLYAWRRRRAEKKADPFRVKRFSLFGGGSTAGYAPQAASLTRGLMKQFNPEAAAGWSCVIGLHLMAEGGVKEEKYGLRVKNGRAELEEGTLPADAALTLKIPAGTWAAILLKKKRLEMALIQGKLKLEGKAEEGLKLREVFRL
jgi:putative sterol carrier protein